MSNPDKEYKKVIAVNKKARFDYFIEETFEAGVVLKGSEVKSIRAGHVNMLDAFAEVKDEEIFLMGMHVSEYKGANRFNHVPKRPRKVLMRKGEIRRFLGKLKIKGYTLAPLSIYINNKNLIKIEMGLAKGKKQHDKRETIKQREWNRQKQRVLKGE